MTFVLTPGFVQPPIPRWVGTVWTSSLMDAATEKCAWVGRVWNKDRAAKQITKIGFMTGAITPNGSTMRISLQDVDLTAGAPGRPDGVQDQVVSFADTAPTADTWYHTAALNANRSVAYGELISVVLEYQTFGTGTIFNVKNIPAVNTLYAHTGYFNLFTSSWAKVNVLPNIILEFSDGTFGTLAGAFPASAIINGSFNSSAVPDEIALRFQTPFACKVDGCWIMLATATGRDCEIGLYEGTTPLVTVFNDAETLGTVSQGMAYFPFAEQTLSPGIAYYMSYKGLGTSAISYYATDVIAANHFQAHAAGVEYYHADRADGGAWNHNTLRRPLIGVSFSAVDAAGGGGGGGGEHFGGFAG